MYLFYQSPLQGDLVNASDYIYILTNNVYMNPVDYEYFSFPMFFILVKEYSILFGVSYTTLINIGITIFLLIIPIFLFSSYKNINQSSLFIIPVLYILIVYYFINIQFVPQGLGLLYLIIAINFYLFYKEYGNNYLLYFSVISYFMCVYTHPFMFIFFIFVIILLKLFKFYKIFLLKPSKVQLIKNFVIKGKYFFRKIGRGIYINDFVEKLKGRQKFKDISIFLLIAIYLFGLFTRFNYMLDQFNTIINPPRERGETWNVIFSILGVKKEIGKTIINIYPLYNLISENMVIISKYTSLAVLLSVLIIIIFSIIKALIYKKIEVKDIVFSIGSFIFFILGILNPSILGQRSLQVFFIPLTKFNKINKGNKKIIILIFISIILLSPLILTFSHSVIDTYNGNNFIEDEETINSGKFLNNHLSNGTSILLPEIRIYPTVAFLEQKNIEVSLIEPINMQTKENTYENLDIILNSEKLQNRLMYYGEDPIIINENRSIVYNIGNTNILY